jgi:hypothetical protein
MLSQSQVKQLKAEIKKIEKTYDVKIKILKVDSERN